MNALSITNPDFINQLKQQMTAANDVYKSGYEEGRKVGYAAGMAAGIAEARRIMEQCAPEIGDHK